MVQPDRGDRRHLRLHDVRGVETAAEPDLHDRDIHMAPRKLQKRHRRHEFEETGIVIGAEPLQIAGDRPQFVHVGDDLHLAQPLPVHLHPLTELDEVRRRIEAGPPTRGVQDGVEHGGHRSLAVGAGHVNHRITPLRMVQRFDEHAHPVDAKLQSARLEAEQVVLNRGVGG